jgi:hypothetical protein
MTRVAHQPVNPQRFATVVTGASASVRDGIARLCATTSLAEHVVAARWAKSHSIPLVTQVTHGATRPAMP